MTAATVSLCSFHGDHDQKYRHNKRLGLGWDEAHIQPRLIRRESGRALGKPEDIGYQSIANLDGRSAATQVGTGWDQRKRLREQRRTEAKKSSERQGAE